MNQNIFKWVFITLLITSTYSIFGSEVVRFINPDAWSEHIDVTVKKNYKVSWRHFGDSLANKYSDTVTLWINEFSSWTKVKTIYSDQGYYDTQFYDDSYNYPAAPLRDRKIKFGISLGTGSLIIAESGDLYLDVPNFSFVSTTSDDGDSIDESSLLELKWDTSYVYDEEVVVYRQYYDEEFNSWESVESWKGLDNIGTFFINMSEGFSGENLFEIYNMSMPYTLFDSLTVTVIEKSSTKLKKGFMGNRDEFHFYLPGYGSIYKGKAGSVKKIEIYNVQGQKIDNFNVVENVVVWNNERILRSKGFYIVRFIGERNFTKKIIIR
jgi:hypothetical protein